MHEGHRKRIMAKAATNAAGLEDHELLEIVLFQTIPRKNTNPIAHELIYAFGSLSAVFEASYEQLLTVDGVGEATASYLRTVGEVMKRASRKQEDSPELFSVQSFSENLRKNYEPTSMEYIEIFCLDERHRVCFRRRYASESGGHVSVPAEVFARTVIAQNANGLVIVHNHPMAPPVPSREDDEFTARVAALCSISGVLFCDHIILGENAEIYSYYLDGKLDTIRKAAGDIVNKMGTIS